MAPSQLANAAGLRGRCAGGRLLVRGTGGTKLEIGRKVLVTDRWLNTNDELADGRRPRCRSGSRNGGLVDRVVVVIRLSPIERGPGIARRSDRVAVLMSRVGRGRAGRQRGVRHGVHRFDSAVGAGRGGGQAQRNENPKSWRTHGGNLPATACRR